MQDDGKDFEQLEAVLARSLAARMAVATVERIRSACGSSRVMSQFAGLGRQIAACSTADRLRAAGAMVASFGVTTAAVVALVPRAAAPALPWSAFLGDAAFGVALIVGADAFANAWRHRRRRG